MPEPTAAHPRELADYTALVRRRWRWVAGGMVLGLLLGFAYLSVAQVRYSSTAKVLVQDTGSGPAAVGARTNSAINLDTEAQLVRSEPVAERAGELLGSDQSAVALANRVSVTVPANTTVLAITYIAGNATSAQNGADKFAQAYIENRQSVAQAALDSDVARLQDRIEQTTQDIQDTNVALARLGGSEQKADRAFLVARRSALSSQLQSYNTELAPLVGASVDAGEIIVDAQVPQRPVNPNPMLVLPASLMLGLLVGLAAAGWRDRSDKRIHSGADVERVFGIAPVLALPTEVSHRDSGPGGVGGHAVLMLHHQLRAETDDESQVAMLVGPDAADVAEHLAYSLAVAAARSGSPTTYVARTGSPTLITRHRTKVENNGTLELSDYSDLGLVVDGEFRATKLRDRIAAIAAKSKVVILGLPNDDPDLDLPVLARHLDVAIVVVALGASLRATTAAVLGDLSKYGVERVLVVTVGPQRRGWRAGRGTTASLQVAVESEESEAATPVPAEVGKRPGGQSAESRKPR